MHGEYACSCHICDFKTNTKTKLNEHLFEEHGISKYKGDFTCHNCEYRSDQRSSLNKHLLRMHSEYRQYGFIRNTLKTWTSFIPLGLKGVK